MRPRLALLLGALVVPALPLVVSPPAQAASTICVTPVTAGVSCTSTVNNVQAAITASVSGDTIRLGSTTYGDGPYVLKPGVTLRGGGAGTGPSATKIVLAAGAQTYVTVSGGGTVADLRVDMTSGNGATGIAASSGAIVDNVVVFGPGATSSNGVQAEASQVHDATINVTGGSGNTAVRSLGSNLLYSDSTWNGGAVGYRLVSGTDTVSRITVALADTGISVEGGTLNIDDAVIELGAAGQTGLVVTPKGTSDDAIVHANHLTVVGGSGTSRGVVADANGPGTLLSEVTLQNSIVRGPATSLVRSATGDDTANFTVTRTDYQVATGAPTDGGGNLNLDPAFVNTAGGDYHLRATSPVVDKAAASAAALDRDGKGRSFDGNKDGTPVPDMGAYELRDVTAPKTTFSSGPQGPTNDNTPVFQFKADESDAVLECRVDGGGWFSPCTSPATTAPLADGAHTFQVRARDEVFNVEDPPATRSFVVDTSVPDTTITKKPPKRFFKQRVKFKFTGNEPGVTFQCQLDNGPWRTCRSPYRFNTKVGKHRMLVRAKDAAGNVDATPARYKYKRLPRHRHHHRPHHRPTARR